MILRQLEPPWDLSVASLDYAVEKLTEIEGVWNTTLYVSVALAHKARHELHQKDFLVDTDLSREEWYLTGKWNGIFSAGA